MQFGTLYIVATPIGNLEDITLRALRVLREVDLIAAEDTRHTRKLLTHFGIRKPLTSYYEHNSELKGEALLSHLREGQNVALVTDAGTPCISDPGYLVVRDAAAAGITVVPVPGPSALAAAISVSGLPATEFAFAGFLPPRGSKRRLRLEELKREPRTLVFYESPQRLLGMLKDSLAIMGDRPAVVGREITKLHEQFLRGTLSNILGALEQQGVRGEVVVLISPEQGPVSEEEVDLHSLLLDQIETKGLTLKEAVAAVVAVTGRKRSHVYAAALVLKKIREK